MYAIISSIMFLTSIPTAEVLGVAGIICACVLVTLFVTVTPVKTFSIILKNLVKIATIEGLSSNLSTLGSLGLIVVARNSAPSTAVLCGTIIGNTSLYIPGHTLTVVVPLNPSSAFLQANCIVR